MPRRSNYDLLLLAGPSREGTFPPGLNTTAPATEIRTDESPDCYGLNLGVDGAVASGTIPSGTARVARTVTLTEGAISVPYLWHYRRLWNITGRTASTASNTLKVGAQNYDAKYFQQGPDMSFAEDSATILALVPFAEDSMAVVKSTGSYILNNINDTRGTHLIQRTPLIQELKAAGATYVTELDNAVYVSNANGLFSYENGVTKELTRKVRDGLTNFTSLALVSNYEKKYIIAGTKFVYEPATDKLFSWASSGFRFTTRQWHLPDYAAAYVDRIQFIVEHADTNAGTMKYQVKYDDGPWSDEYTVSLDEEIPGITTSVWESAEQARQSQRFQVRLTSLSSNKYIREIRLDVSGADLDAYTEQPAV